MLNEKILSDGKTIVDILTEFYEKHKNDRQLVDELIEAFKIKEGAISPFIADNAQLITSLMNARQKTTSDLLSMLNTVQKLQANELNSDSSGLDSIEQYMSNSETNEEDDEEFEDLLEKIKKENGDNEKVTQKIITLNTGR